MEPLGEISIKPCDHDTVKEGVMCILLLGPTGAGKSHFIESIASPDSLNISSDQLDGFTQEVRAYEVINPRISSRFSESSVYLIDTPGFSNADKTDMDVFNQVKGFMVSKKLGLVMRTTILKLQSLLEKSPFDMRRLTIVTMMWDTIATSMGEQMAYGRFDEYRHNIFKEFVKAEARVSQYRGTRESALRILHDTVDQGYHGVGLYASDISESSLGLSHLFPVVATNLGMSRSKQRDYREQKREFYANPNKRLESIVLPALQKADEDVKRIRDQLLALQPDGSIEIHYEFDRLWVQDREDEIYYTKEDITAIQDALARSGPGTDPSGLEQTLAKAQEALDQARKALRAQEELHEIGSYGEI
ncbi:hypothetical protein BJ165DRAFT_1410280 [Panaeolus papilionaceus]|nr:hypothetical protein BJ165DRAFT_1410280 [Panaeolus papilionaceus]